MRVLLSSIFGGTALYSVSMTHSASTSGAVPIDTDQSGCNLNEPWLCSEYMYYECHTCTLNNVCIFNEFAFLESGDFNNKMTHHCQNLPFDCNYFHEIKQCRSRYCATQTLCNLDVDGYEVCLIKALLCYDEYCEPDLSSLPLDYRLYDLCCHINDIETDGGRFQNWLIMVLGVITIIILLSLYEIYTAFTKHSLQKQCHSMYKKVKYFVKYIIKNYITMKNVEYFYNEICKKGKKMKRNIKYHYKNNKMMWCFFNLFDDYVIKITDSSIAPLFWIHKDQKQKNGDIIPSTMSPIADEGNKSIAINTNHHHHNNDKTKKSKASNKKKRKAKDGGNHKKKKKTKNKYKASTKTHKSLSSSASPSPSNSTKENKEEPIECITMECAEQEQDHDIEDASESNSGYDDEGNGNGKDECKQLSEHEMEPNKGSIEMISCPVCGAMNAQYLSNCDQCKRSMSKNKKKKKKNKKSKQKKKGNGNGNGKEKSMDYWQCLHCTYHNQLKYKKCLMCHNNKEDSKFSTKSTKKAKKKKTEKMQHKERQKYHKEKASYNNNNVNQIYLNQSRKQIVPHRISPKKPQHKSRNVLNPNAKEFVFDSKSVLGTNNGISPHGICSNNNYVYSSYSPHSPSRRLSKIPRLQKSVNPEPDYAPRHSSHHTRNNMYCGETNGYNEPSNHAIPPRFHSPPFHHHSNSMSSGSEDRADFEMASSSISDQTLMDSTSVYPVITIPMITPMLPTVSVPVPVSVSVPVPVSAGLPVDIDNADLQRQLSDMEANVHKQLQVLDSLFPTMKPDLSQEIKAMQENMKVEI